MSIDQEGTVDFVTFDKKTGKTCLIITDHLAWYEDDGQHLLLLQNKLNAYLSFLESGEIYETFPEANGSPISIVVVGKFPLSDQAKSFFEMAGRAIREAGFSLQFELHSAH